MTILPALSFFSNFILSFDKNYIKETMFSLKKIEEKFPFLRGVALGTSTREEWIEMGAAIVAGIEAGWVNPVINQVMIMIFHRRFINISKIIQCLSVYLPSFKKLSQ